ncbi:hypothetical protein D3C81_522660 [compost metagenome]
MALRRVDLQVADVLARGHQRVHQFPRTGRGEAPVGGERHHAEFCGGAGEGFRQVIVEIGRRVEVVQGLGHQQISVGVETPRELFTLITQVAFDLELDAVEVVIELLALQATAEFLAHGIVGQVSDVPDHPCQHQPALGDHALFLERAAVELGVGEDRLTRHFVEGDVLRRQLRRRGDGQAMADAVRVSDAPLHRLHAAEAAADHGRELGDAETVRQTRLTVHPVFHGQYRKVGAERLAGVRVDTARAGGTVAAAEVVQADHEELAGVDRLAGTDAAVPPTGFAVVGAVVAGGVVVTGQGVADQHGVARRGVERAVGFVDQVIGRERATAGQRQGFAEVRHLRRHQTNRIGGKGSWHRPCSH